MKALSFTPLAEADIEAIWDYSAENWGLEQAELYTDEIRHACHALASGRNLGRATNVRPGYRKCTTGSHVIYFRDRGDWLEIVRILHVAQDAERHIVG
ncbi:type II toxin-antitoxin system RelE/ParE family toxin [Paracoccus sp. IB05]|uniref:type II toxin-antitoxin system RelE/ParE family toxin n=1 Tax=Paracoccus sp. IB05 TaxID=2779367 RepID=UPI0018E7C397|nr:type II toxin-antitoxin system RelE/ParE family toxin [Paracoccus sp. IB05]MBJ2153177.1 type II toxin-antitoxin system RelE/ParE family toxin [Paracoccus sp. IB05]